MTVQFKMSRRDFLRCGAMGIGSLSAAAFSPAHRQRAKANVLGANERIRIGVIGMGARGKYLIGNLPDSARVVAICDCAMSQIANTLRPKQAIFREVLGGFLERDAADCSTHQDYRQMIDTVTMDAVIIATPDHHHVQAATLALGAGLDVYLEKPLTLTIAEGRYLVDVVKKSGRVLQVGSQQRTMEMNRFACEFVRDGGIGRVTRVDFPNYPGPLSDPRFPVEPVPGDLDWDLFLGPTPQRSYHHKLWVKDSFNVGGLLWRGWDLFRDYSGHLMTNWGAHSIDMVQYALGMDHSGPVQITPVQDFSEATLERDWNDKWHLKTPRPDGPWRTASRFRPVTLKYANGTSLNLLPGVTAATFHGQRGRMIISRNSYRCDPPDLVQGGPDPKAAEKWKGDGYVARPHLQNWLDCVRSRHAPNAPVEVGHRSVTVCHLVNIARELNRPLNWDPASEAFPDDAQANLLCVRPRRQGFELPAL